MEIYIVTVVYGSKYGSSHHTTVYSNYEDAYNRVQYLLKGYNSNEYLGYCKWKAYSRTETVIKTTVQVDQITIERFTYSEGHDEWVFN